jgi:hypothetical protein
MLERAFEFGNALIDDYSSCKEKRESQMPVSGRTRVLPLDNEERRAVQ